jgi:hypothetical protein
MDHLLSREHGSHEPIPKPRVVHRHCHHSVQGVSITDAPFQLYTDFVIDRCVLLATGQLWASVQGRHDEHTMDALALRADEGRGTAPICLGEPLTGLEPRISE